MAPQNKGTSGYVESMGPGGHGLDVKNLWEVFRGVLDKKRPFVKSGTSNSSSCGLHGLRARFVVVGSQLLHIQVTIFLCAFVPSFPKFLQTK